MARSRYRPRPHPHIKVEYKGTAWLAIKFAAFFRGPFTYADLNFMNPTAFPYGRKVKDTRTLKRMVNNGIFVKLDHDKWALTPFGRTFYEDVSLYLQENNL